MPNFQYTFTFKITSNLSISKWDFSISNDKIGQVYLFFDYDGHDHRATNEKIGKFTKSEMMELVPTASRASVENSLKALVVEGLLERHGQGKATFYIRKK